jgi:hypothetical protein
MYLICVVSTGHSSIARIPSVLNIVTDSTSTKTDHFANNQKSEKFISSLPAVSAETATGDETDAFAAENDVFSSKNDAFMSGNDAFSAFDATTTDTAVEASSAFDSFGAESNDVFGAPAASDSENPFGEASFDAPAFGDSDAFGDENDAFSSKNDAFGGENDAFSTKNDAFGGENDAFSVKNDAFGDENDAFSSKNDAFSGKNDAFGDDNDAFSGKHDAFGAVDDVFSTKDSSVAASSPFGGAESDPFGSAADSTADEYVVLNEEGNEDEADPFAEVEAVR